MADRNSDIGKLGEKLAASSRHSLRGGICPACARDTSLPSPQKRLQLLQEWLEQGGEGDAAALENVVADCLICRRCSTEGPDGANRQEIFSLVKKVLAERRGQPLAKTFLLRGLLAHPTLFTFAAAFASTWQTLFLRRASESLETNRIAFPGGAPVRRHVPRIAERFFARMWQGSLDIMPRQGEPRVLFFPGCFSDKIYVKTAQACLKIFQHLGTGVIMPSGLGCCGLPALMSGDWKTFGGLVRHNMTSIMARHFDYLVTPCASCAATIAAMWKSADAPGDMNAAIEGLSGRVMDISRFVVEVLGMGAIRVPRGGRRIAFHDACQLAPDKERLSAAREMIRMNPAYEFVETPQTGCGGGFRLKQTGLSQKMAEDAGAVLRKSAVEEVAVACSGCRLQLADTLSRQGQKLRVRHVAEIYADTLPDQGTFW